MELSSGTFLWGAATSAHQVEGDNKFSDWWAWEAKGNCEGGVVSGGAADHWNRFREDLKAAAEMGLNSYRFSVEWARLEPQPGKFCAEAFGRYSEILDECEKLGLLPMVTLHHFTLPQWMAELGGIASPEFPRRFEKFTAEVVDRIGSRIPLWCTLNEPMVLSLGSYLGKFMPPARFSTVEFADSCAHQLAAHVLAYETIHRKLGAGESIRRTGKFADFPLGVGLAHNMIDFRPDHFWHPMEQILTQVLHRLYNLAWLRGVSGLKPRFGVPGLVPRPRVIHEALGRRTVDFLGINYYMKAYVQWHPKDASQGTSPHLPIGLAFSRRGEECSDLGWAIHPRGLRRMLATAAQFGVPLYVTENGIADASDKLRPHYLRSHLHEVALARSQGIDVRGYYHWSLLDNFEWSKGFKPRFGLLGVDYETFERKKTRSCELLQGYILAHEKTGRAWPTPDLFES